MLRHPAPRAHRTRSWIPSWLSPWQRGAHGADVKGSLVGTLVGFDDPAVKEFQQELETLGWSEGRNIHTDYRYAPAGAQAELTARMSTFGTKRSSRPCRTTFGGKVTANGSKAEVPALRPACWLGDVRSARSTEPITNRECARCNFFIKFFGSDLRF